MNDVTYVFIVISFFLVIIIIVGCYFYFHQASTLIAPSQCPKVLGKYGSNPGLIGSRILYQCGQDSKSQCSFFSIPSLTAATNLCNSYLNVCNAFSYSPASQNVLFIDPNSILTSSTIYDTYVLQYNVIT